MKRSVFIKAVAAIAATAALPVLYNSSRTKGHNNSLSMPGVLSGFCDEIEIHEIGLKYRSMIPSENNKEKLTELLLANRKNKKNTSLSNSEIGELINKNIRNEYSGYNTMVINGWVISPTEARQCALFSLTKN
jgi:hypothetical protein